MRLLPCVSVPPPVQCCPTASFPLPPLFRLQHYFATLLASKGLDDETICHINGVVWADWSQGGAHPRAYR